MSERRERYVTQERARLDAATARCRRVTMLRCRAPPRDDTRDVADDAKRDAER